MVNDNTSMHLMFDVDDTLVQSTGFDDRYFLESVKQVLGFDAPSNWENYPHVTDRGILLTLIERFGLSCTLSELENKVKPLFVDKIKTHLAKHPVKEVDGAVAFLNWLKTQSHTTLSIATGGWGETALAKLHSAGFDLVGVQMASSNDHYDRIEIMKIAASRAQPYRAGFAYFGDAAWDVAACEALGADLIIVGSKTTHKKVISNFSDMDAVIDIVYRNG